jgi:NAD(P)-dependent dehydrogenase (short-subunit alcohol dehydrogenase family)
MQLQGKVAVVTGAARGIGLACAARFAAEGAKVVVADILDQEGATAVEKIGADGGLAAFVHCDTGAKALIATTIERFGGLDILVNNAGIATVADFLEVTEEDFDRVLRVNLKGYFLVGQAAAREMVARAGGSIINMSSVNAVMAIEGITPYVVSKGGVNQLTSVMAIALAKRGVRVNAIGPGTIMTAMSAGMRDDDEARHRLLSRTPLGRFGEPADIAGIALFLASDDAAYVTGQVIYADGGRLKLNYTVSVDG